MSRTEYLKKKKKQYLKEMLADPNDPRHGTKTGYTYGCRCDKCTAANTKYSRQYNFENAYKISRIKLDRKYEVFKEMRKDPNHPEHGTTYGYECGCRCDRCSAAHKHAWNVRAAKHLKQMQENPNDPNHGTLAGYNYGCRCERCKAAMQEYQRKTKEQRSQAMKRLKKNVYEQLMANPEDRRHGTYYGYNCGCRCERCKAARNVYIKKKELQKLRERKQHGED